MIIKRVFNICQFNIIKAIVLITIDITIIESQRLHVKEAMSTGEIKTFDISQAKKIAFDIKKRCTLEENKYKVMKVEEDDQLVFYAITGETFHRLPSDDFENQIGQAECKNGWIENVSVETKARNCGLSPVLAGLCMIDPDLSDNSQNFENLVYENLDRGLERNDEIEQAEEYLRSNCVNLIGLWMKASPMSGAFAYFSAAKRSHYHHMVVQFYDNGLDKCGRKFKYYTVKHAKSLYDENTGQIEDDEGDPVGSGFQAKWYFCKLSGSSSKQLPKKESKKLLLNYDTMMYQ